MTLHMSDNKKSNSRQKMPTFCEKKKKIQNR